LKLEHDHKDRSGDEDRSKDEDRNEDEDRSQDKNKSESKDEDDLKEAKLSASKSPKPSEISPVRSPAALTQRSKGKIPQVQTLKHNPSGISIANPSGTQNQDIMGWIHSSLTKITFKQWLQIICFVLRFSSVILIIYVKWYRSDTHTQIMNACHIAIVTSSFLSVAFFIRQDQHSF
jgi:hypothetical protein